MRVFQVCADPGIPPGGVRGGSIHLRSFASALVTAGHEVAAFTYLPLNEGESYPATVFPLDSAHSVLAAALSCGSPDVIYERYSLTYPRDAKDAWSVSTAGLEAARALGCQFVLEVNAPLIREARDHRGLQPHPQLWDDEATLFSEADLVVTVSTGLQRMVSELRGRSEGVVVIRNGCNPLLFDRTQPVRAGNVLAFLGDPRPWHGADVLPEVLSDLCARGGDPHLLLIGGGSGAAEVMRCASARGVEHRIHVTGAVPHDVAAGLLMGADVGVAPYPPLADFYFSPLKVVEYMAAGLPVVTTDQGDLAEIVGDCGFLVEPGDIDTFTSIVGGLLSDTEARRRIGERARLRALENFTWAHAVAELDRWRAPTQLTS